MSSIIEVQNLVKKYKNTPNSAIDDISFEVNEGEFFSFLGPNGAGKTTTISVLTTTLSKTSGTVKIGGYDIDKQASEVRAKIGVIFQKPSLDLNLTAEENIRLHCVLYKMYNFQPSYALMPKSYKDKVAQLAEVLELKNDIFKPIKTYSGGMKRKLEIVRTLMHQPKVLFLDEPTSGLDPLSRKNLWTYLKDIRQKENTTIFLTTHYLEEAEDADTVCVINHGKIIVNSTVNDIKNKLVKHYIYAESNNNNELKQELQRLNYKFEESGNGYNIYSQKEDSQKIIKSINATLTELYIHQPTLEDVYLDLIKGNDD